MDSALSPPRPGFDSLRGKCIFFWKISFYLLLGLTSQQGFVEILRPPHAYRFFVAELKIFCRGQICRDIRLTAFRLSQQDTVDNSILYWRVILVKYSIYYYYDRVIQMKMAPIRRKLKLALLIYIVFFLRWVKRRRNKGKRSTWVKSWITRRNEQGVYVQQLNSWARDGRSAWLSVVLLII